MAEGSTQNPCVFATCEQKAWDEDPPEERLTREGTYEDSSSEGEEEEEHEVEQGEQQVCVPV